MNGDETKKGFFTQAMEFIPQVRHEVKKVTWPTRRETGMTTVFVLVFAMIAALYFMLVDQVVYRFVQFILGLGE